MQSLSCQNSWRNGRQMEQKSKGLRFPKVMNIAL
nr:MAG TPA: hypothetical protein [Caudoviricetes sp.]